MAFKFNAEVRQAQGKGASRRLRHNGQIPAIIYGGSEAPVSIILNHDELNNAQAHDSFYSDVITLVVEGKEVAVKVQAMQRHPFKPKLVHIDFTQILAEQHYLKFRQMLDKLDVPCDDSVRRRRRQT